jgi:hypothetical protein
MPKYIHTKTDRRRAPCRRYTAKEFLPRKSRYLLERMFFTKGEKWIPRAMSSRPIPE